MGNYKLQIAKEMQHCNPLYSHQSNQFDKLNVSIPNVQENPFDSLLGNYDVLSLL